MEVHKAAPIGACPRLGLGFAGAAGAVGALRAGGPPRRRLRRLGVLPGAGGFGVSGLFLGGLRRLL